MIAIADSKFHVKGLFSKKVMKVGVMKGGLFIKLINWLSKRVSSIRWFSIRNYRFFLIYPCLLWSPSSIFLKNLGLSIHQFFVYRRENLKGKKGEKELLFPRLTPAPQFRRNKKQFLGSEESRKDVQVLWTPTYVSRARKNIFRLQFPTISCRNTDSKKCSRQAGIVKPICAVPQKEQPKLPIRVCAQKNGKSQPKRFIKQLLKFRLVRES